MVDSTLMDLRDEFFADIQVGDLVFYRDHEGQEVSGWARTRTVGGWCVWGDHDKDSPAIVHELENYLGHISRKQMSGRAA